MIPPKADNTDEVTNCNTHVTEFSEVSISTALFLKALSIARQSLQSPSCETSHIENIVGYYRE